MRRRSVVLSTLPDALRRMTSSGKVDPQERRSLVEPSVDLEAVSTDLEVASADLETASTDLEAASIDRNASSAQAAGQPTGVELSKSIDQGSGATNESSSVDSDDGTRASRGRACPVMPAARGVDAAADPAQLDPHLMTTTL